MGAGGRLGHPAGAQPAKLAALEALPRTRPRGAAFVFRQYGSPGPTPGADRPVRGTQMWGRVFAISSLATPFALGAAAGALATGTLRPDGSAGLWRPYLAPLPLLAGLLAVACCAYLAAVYLSRDAERNGSPRLAGRFRRRALGSGVLAGTLALAALPGFLAGELRGVGLPAVTVSALGGLLGLLLLWRRHHGLARVAAACGPAGLLAGLAMALYPWVLPGQVRLDQSAAPAEMAGPVLAVLLAGLVVVTPCSCGSCMCGPTEPTMPAVERRTRPRMGGRCWAFR